MFKYYLSLRVSASLVAEGAQRRCARQCFVAGSNLIFRLLRFARNDGIVLFFLAAAIFLTGCDSGIYSAEKRFWRSSKAFNQIVKAPEKATPVDYQKVIDSFREITIRYLLWPTAAQAQFNIGHLYAMQGNLSRAKDEFGVVLKDYPENADISAKSLFMTALIHEKEENWPKAKEALDKIMKDYPDTMIALQAPIHIAEYYKIKGRNAEAEAAYAAALEKYKKAVEDNPKTYGAILTVDLIITCYMAQEKWDEASEYLSGLVTGYPDTLLAPKALFIKGAIYEQKLDRPGKAREIYREVMENYSKTPFAKAAQERLEKLDKPE